MKLIIFTCILFTLNACMFNATSNKNGVRSPASSGYQIEGIVDPISGAIAEKVSLDKSFSGGLKLKIQNLREFSEENIKVDISFGHLDDTSKTLSGAIQKEGEDYFLLINLYEREFNDIALNYNLFDYSNYGSLKISSPDIVQSNLDSNLYCRGLKAEDDPTLTKTTCSDAGDKCLYTYAKISDQGLLNQNTGTFEVPSVMQFTRDDGGFQNEVEKCLDDDSETYIGGIRLPVDSSISIGGFDYTFKGPYQAQDKENWQISSDAIWGEFGVFGIEDLSGGKNIDRGYFSRLFPIASKVKLSNFLLYIGSDNPRSAVSIDPVSGAIGGRTTRSQLDAQGLTSFWMTGCNRRVQTKSSISGEDISSCNVSALIEVYYFDRGEKVIIASTDDESSKNIRLQLVNNSSSNSTSGGEACISDSGCGATECCLGNQCVSEATGACEPIGGLIATGETCDEDYKCRSGCCKAGVCTAHDGQTNFCNKEVNESCLSSIFCAMDEQLFAARILEDSNGDCRKVKCNLDRLNCLPDSFTCRRNALQGNQGSENNPIDNYSNWVTGDCNGAIPESETTENGWVCIPF